MDESSSGENFTLILRYTGKTKSGRNEMQQIQHHPSNRFLKIIGTFRS